MDTVSPSSAPTGSAASSPAGRRDLTPTEFASTVTAITAAFGDPTRRDIFLFAHASDDGVTAAETAKHFDLHANVARHHLDKLASGGYLVVEMAKPSGGVGRPSKRYTTTDDQVHLEVDVRQDDILVGAQTYGSGGEGAFFLFHGPLTGSLSASSADVFIEGSASGAGLGTSISRPSDLDGDGLLDVGLRAELEALAQAQ